MSIAFLRFETLIQVSQDYPAQSHRRVFWVAPSARRYPCNSAKKRAHANVPASAPYNGYKNKMSNFQFSPPCITRGTSFWQAEFRLSLALNVNRLFDKYELSTSTSQTSNRLACYARYSICYRMLRIMLRMNLKKTSHLSLMLRCYAQFTP